MQAQCQVSVLYWHCKYQPPFKPIPAHEQQNESNLNPQIRYTRYSSKLPEGYPNKIASETGLRLQRHKPRYKNME